MRRANRGRVPRNSAGWPKIGVKDSSEGPEQARIQTDGCPAALRLKPLGYLSLGRPMKSVAPRRQRLASFRDWEVGGLILAADFLALWHPGLNPKWMPVVLHGAVALAAIGMLRNKSSLDG